MADRLTNRHFAGVIALLQKLQTQEMRDDPEGELTLDTGSEEFRASRSILNGIAGDKAARDNDPALAKYESMRGRQEVARGDRRPRANDAARRALATDARLVGASHLLAGCHGQFLGGAAAIQPRGGRHSVDSIFGGNATPAPGIDAIFAKG